MRHFEQYRELVFQDGKLQQALDAIPGDGEFAALASRQAREHGLELSSEEVLEALQRSRQAWLLRTLR